MKAISVDGESVNIGGTDYPVVKLYADSAIGRDVMPLFVPDIPLTWHDYVCVAIRVVRLGKNIAPRFALRYIDAIGLVNVLSPDTTDMTGKALERSDYATLIDGAVTIGRWVDFDPSVPTIDIEVNHVKKTYSIADLDIASHVSLISRLATIKTGDLIILKKTAIDMQLMSDTTITGSIQGVPCLNIKVKM